VIRKACACASSIIFELRKMLEARETVGWQLL
jgi:hypothetical protein